MSPNFNLILSEPVQPSSSPSSPKSFFSSHSNSLPRHDKMSSQRTPTGLSLSSVTTMDLHVYSASEKRSEISSAFNDLFTLYENLFTCVSDAGLFMRADPLRHPLIFYLGHTATFYMNKLILAKVLSYKDRINPTVESLVAVGVDEMSWDDLLPDDFQWPSSLILRDYRNQIRSLVTNLILEGIPLLDNSLITWESPMWTILMGIEHERIHLETSCLLIRQLPISEITFPSFGNAFSRVCDQFVDHPSKVSSNPWIPVPSGEVTLGRPLIPSLAKSLEHKLNYATIYGWDNEFGYSVSQVSEFQSQQKLVTNSDWLTFIEDGGYKMEKYWSVEGVQWIKYFEPTKARFWLEQADGTWGLRDTLREMSQLPWDWPVEVNLLEASAYCRWYSERNGIFARLPSEAEYMQVLNLNDPKEESLPHILPTNSNLGLQNYSSSCPVDKYKTGNFYDLSGNVWQWTGTPMHPFEGFQVHPHYDDFSAPCFDDQHNLMKGGSWASTGNEAYRGARFAFRRHFYQNCGFRMVTSTVESTTSSSSSSKSTSAVNPIKSIAELALGEPDFHPYNSNVNALGDVVSQDSTNVYETGGQVSQYCEFHYSSVPSPIPGIDNFAVVSARICEAVMKGSELWKSRKSKDTFRALDLGCAVGRSSFELTRTFDQVIGLDFSARFIQVGSHLKEKGRINFSTPIEGELVAYREAILGQKDLSLDGSHSWGLVENLFGKTSISEEESKLSLSTLTSRVQFWQGDACNLSSQPQFQKFHLVLAANLIDRLANPAFFLTTIHERILSNGFLILLSPYTWLEEFTSKDMWIGGKKVKAESLTTKDGLEEMLSPWFDLVSLTPSNPNWKDVCESLGGGLQTLPGSPISSFHVPMLLRGKLGERT